MSFSPGSSVGVAALPDRWAERIIQAAEAYFDSDVTDSLQVALLACQRAAFENDLRTAPTYLTPLEMFNAVNNAAPHDQAEHSPAIDDNELTAADKWNTAKQQEIARKLAGSFHIGGEFIDRQTGVTRFVEYHVDYVFPEPIAADDGTSAANVTLHITLLRRDDKPVVLSIAQHGIDTKSDQLELTLLLDDSDDLGEKLVCSLA